MYRTKLFLRLPSPLTLYPMRHNRYGDGVKGNPPAGRLPFRDERAGRANKS